MARKIKIKIKIDCFYGYIIQFPNSFYSQNKLQSKKPQFKAMAAVSNNRSSGGPQSNMCYWNTTSRAIGGGADPETMKDLFAEGEDRRRNAKTWSYRANRSVSRGTGKSIIMVGRKSDGSADFEEIQDFVKADSWTPGDIIGNPENTLVITHASDHFTAAKGSELTPAAWAFLVLRCDDWGQNVQVPARTRPDTSMDRAIALSYADQTQQYRKQLEADWMMAKSFQGSE